MKRWFFEAKILCKNGRILSPKTYTKTENPKSLGIAAFWGRLTTGKFRQREQSYGRNFFQSEVCS